MRTVEYRAHSHSPGEPPLKLLPSTQLLVIGLALAFVAAALVWLLPDGAAAGYAEHGQPAFMFAACAAALWVAPMYRGDMRRAFLFLAVFLFLYGFVNIPSLMDEVAEALDDQYLRSLLGYQVLSYAFLLASGAMIVRVVSVRSLTRWSLVAVIATIAYGAVVVGTAIDEFTDLLDITTVGAFSYFLTRLFDVVVMVALVPVLALYIQNARSMYRESASFAVAGAAIISSLTLVYLYELVKWDSLLVIATEEGLTGSTLDFLYLFGYVALVVGLVVHRLHQEVSFRRLDEVLQ